MQSLLFVIGIFFVGLWVGVPISSLVIQLPAALERQWWLESTLFLGLPADLGNRPNRSISLLPDRLNLRVLCTSLSTGLISGWVAWHYGTSPAMFAALMLGWGLLALSIIDFDHQLIPDALSLPLLWLGLITNSFALFTSPKSALWGAIVGYLVLWALHGLSKRFSAQGSIGLGDAKLLALLGAWGGWQILPSTLLMASIAALLVAGGLIKMGKINRSPPIPFGPYLAVAGWLNLLYQESWMSDAAMV